MKRTNGRPRFVDDRARQIISEMTVGVSRLRSLAEELGMVETLSDLLTEEGVARAGTHPNSSLDAGHLQIGSPGDLARTRDYLSGQIKNHQVFESIVTSPVSKKISDLSKALRLVAQLFYEQDAANS